MQCAGWPPKVEGGHAIRSVCARRGRRGGVGKDPLREFLEAVRRHGAATGNLRGLLHALVGRRISRADGSLVSHGMTWRALAAELKRARWERGTVQELALNAADLPPRDRQRFWYTAIAHAGLDRPEAVA